MKTTKKGGSQELTPSPSTLGNYATTVVAEQFRRISKQEKTVLADENPEALHQMRVGTRRLRTALQIFDLAIVLPKAASAKKLRNLARVLGAVRDLDVQGASLQQDYRPHLNKRAQKKLDRLLAAIDRRRSKAFADMEAALSDDSYRELKTSYKNWLKQPQFKPIAAQPLILLLPELLSPLLAELLLHPGWLVSAEAADFNSTALHDLRKACKHVRYQAEFFAPFYGRAFEQWIQEVKELQDRLGELQDTQVLRELIADELGETDLPELEANIQQKRGKILTDWDGVRTKYLDAGYRSALHRMLLHPEGLHPSPSGHSQDELAALN